MYNVGGYELQRMGQNLSDRLVIHVFWRYSKLSEYGLSATQIALTNRTT